MVAFGSGGGIGRRIGNVEYGGKALSKDVAGSTPAHSTKTDW